MNSRLAALTAWVDAVVRLTESERVYWCDGSQAEIALLNSRMFDQGELLALNPETHPNCWLHRSDPTDVARVEHLTFVYTQHPEDAGPNFHAAGHSTPQHESWERLLPDPTPARPEHRGGRQARNGCRSNLKDLHANPTYNVTDRQSRAAVGPVIRWRSAWCGGFHAA